MKEESIFRNVELIFRLIRTTRGGVTKVRLAACMHYKDTNEIKVCSNTAVFNTIEVKKTYKDTEDPTEKSKRALEKFKNKVITAFSMPIIDVSYHVFHHGEPTSILNIKTAGEYIKEREENNNV